MTFHRVITWLTLCGMAATIYLVWDGWDWTVGVTGAVTFIGACVSAYTE